MMNQIEQCPYCGEKCEADWCDVGVPGAMQQVGPFHCMACGASEIGTYDEERELTEQEKKTGWYAPGAEPGSSANVIDGKIVSHTEINKAYRDEFVGNPLYHLSGYVERWWENIRRRK